MPLTVLTASGDAPGYSTSMAAPGMSILGIASSPRPRYEARPSTTIATITMVAKTGFWILVLVIHMAAILFRQHGRLVGGDDGRQLDQVARLDAVEARDDHVGALAEAGRHLGIALVVVAQAQLHRLGDDLAVLDLIHHLPALVHAQRGRRHDGRRARAVGDDAALGEHAAAQRAVLVGDGDVDQHGARAGLGGRIDARHLAVEIALLVAVDLEADILADLDARDFGGRHLRLQRQLRQVDDGVDGHVGRDLLAGLHQPLADDAADWGADDGVAQRDAGDLDHRLGRLDRRARHLDAVLRAVVGVLRNIVLLEQG